MTRKSVLVPMPVDCTRYWQVGFFRDGRGPVVAWLGNLKGHRTALAVRRTNVKRYCRFKTHQGAIKAASLAGISSSSQPESGLEVWVCGPSQMTPSGGFTNV